MQEYLIIGRILKPHGVSGEMKIQPLTDDIRRFDDLKCAYIKDKDDMFPHRVERVKYGNDVVYIKLEGIDDMNAARELVNKHLWVDRQHAAPLPEGSYYVGDIIGCRVYTVDGVYLGEVKEVLPTGSNDVYDVVDGQKQVLIPAIKDVIKTIDIEGERIVIEPMEGLLD
ncbi:ribosome maturation factor RimM [Mahella australiensis]|uniref:Ribosome maturation factor RimM n=1 Tax=Mahella australiensis (strain DSM 15567 / CIP 107919 / 50-1 BON) TaxID=697281 RepID=F4A2S7_MAHA5|nr:ribosome maturation factor RimM [Mahella australiensis]AEE96257.1 16S rRNA processing protein RimM [Mahella australiensis 50-1 BON]